MLLCPSMELTVSMGTPLERKTRRGCRVAALMPRDMLGDAATLGDGTDTGKARVIMRNGEISCRPRTVPGICRLCGWRCRAGGCWTPRPFSGG